MQIDWRFWCHKSLESKDTIKINLKLFGEFLEKLRLFWLHLLIGKSDGPENTSRFALILCISSSAIFILLGHMNISRKH